MELVNKIEALLPTIGLWFMIISLVATVLVRVAAWVVKFTETTADDERVAQAQSLVSKIVRGILQLMVHLPTLGKNPQTKEYEKKLKELEGIEDASSQKSA